MTELTQCNKCHYIPVKPFINKDGKIYCYQCSNELFKNNIIQKASETKPLTMIISNLDVYCPNNEYINNNNNESKMDENDEGLINVMQTNEYKCLWKGKLKNINTHVNNECKLTKSYCKYNKIGCLTKQKMNQFYLNNHYIDHKNIHDNIIINNIDKILSIINKKVNYN